ncbi:MAG TPA: sugar phosphate isomerase/epimerase family protein [Anaerovoracaceae bacterium]|nr:sugar phosphate isomerase/epimerase family protein [Anaerovoracaceae bacterium]
MKIAVSGETPGKMYPLSEIAQLIRGYGARAIELWPENVPAGSGQTVHRLYRNRDLGAAKSILDQEGVAVACVAFGGAFDRSIAGDEALYSKELAEAVNAAKYLGVKYVNHYLYYLSMEDRADTERLKRLFSPAIEKAEAAGVTLVLEDEAHDSTKNPVEMLRILEAMDSKYFKVNYDAVNFYQASYEGFPYAYEILKDKIAYIHIKDGCLYVPEHGHSPDALGGMMSGANSGRSIYYPMMGTGILNIYGLIRRIKADGYEGWCTLEPHTTPELWHTYIQAEISYLKETNAFKE